MRRLAIAALATACALAAGRARAQPAGPLYLPLVADRGEPRVLFTPAPPAPEVTWSLVLDRVPVYPDARLELFEVRQSAEPAAAVAYYAIGSAARAEVLDWYRRILPAYGWRPAVDAPAEQRWLQYDAWLAVRYATTRDGAVRLQLAREARAARAVRGVALDPAVPVPAGATRWRYDPADLLTEELHLAHPVDAAHAEMVQALTPAGWAVEAEVGLGDAIWTRFARGDERLLTAVRPHPAESNSTQIGVGRGTCWPEPLPADEARGMSVYLADLAAPPGARIVGYERLENDAVAERWRGNCLDLDFLAAAYLGSLLESGWQPTADESFGAGARREPAALDISVIRTGDDRPLTIAARPVGGGGLMIRLSGDAGLRRVTAGRSLLFPDLPLPAAADALSLDRELAEGWSERERYAIPSGDPAELGDWYRKQMPGADWKFERREPAVVGPGQVFHRGGEEVLVGFGFQPDPTVTFWRRRVCASDRPSPPAAEGTPARRLRELVVYPGAVYDGFASPEERHLVKCAGLDLMADWYRVALERGNWRQAAMEGPADPFRRAILFVRPDELTLPPDRRTAWAEVVLERVWPYHYALILRRDANGIIPLPSPHSPAGASLSGSVLPR